MSLALKPLFHAKPQRIILPIFRPLRLGDFARELIFFIFRPDS